MSVLIAASLEKVSPVACFFVLHFQDSQMLMRSQLYQLSCLLVVFLVCSVKQEVANAPN